VGRINSNCLQTRRFSRPDEFPHPTGFEGVDEEEALAYLEMAYGATIATVDELAATPAAAHT
jgi:hypothetical protein